MKKARIFLTALVVLAVAGGALAFKTKQLFWYAKCDIPSQRCTLESFQSLATTDGGNLDAQFDVYDHACIDNKCTTLTKFIN